MEGRIKYLLQKYFDNSCSKEEYDEVFSYIRSRENDAHIGQVISQVCEDQRHLSARRKISAPLLSIAAAILIIVVAGAAWLMIGQPGRRQTSLAISSHARPATVVKATQRSEYKYLLLPDSTQVWLNAASTLEFPEAFDKRRREVYLKGEAYFDVKHADKTPFVIYTGNVSTEVLGTAFNIKAYPGLEKITVSVKRGKVKVNIRDRAVAVLTKGEQVSISSSDQKIREKKIKEEESSAWHEGNLVYDDYSVADILSDLERVYDVKIRITASLVQQMHVSTSFKRARGVETALEILCRVTDTGFSVEKGMYTIYNH